MRHGSSAEPKIVPTRRARGGMLYDPSEVGNFEEDWLDIDQWRRHAQVDGAARGRGTTYLVSREGQGYALRHYRRGGLAGRVLRDNYLYTGAERTRPVREWRLMHWLYRRGLPVPAPVAARYRRAGPFYRGDLLTVRIDGARSLASRVSEGPLPLPDWIAVGRCIRRFHEAGVHHADLNAHNVLFDAADQVFLVDFDRGRLREPGLWSDSSLVRLRRSLLKISDPLPPGHFTDTDWQSLILGYADEPGAPRARASSQPAAADAPPAAAP